MSSDLFGGIAETLQKEEERLSVELKKLEQAAKETARDLKRVADARKALGCEAKKGRPRKPAPTADDIRGAVIQILADETTLDDQSLRNRVGMFVQSKLGKSRMGLSLRLQEVSKHPDFLVTAEGWSLVTSSANDRQSDSKKI